MTGVPTDKNVNKSQSKKSFYPMLFIMQSPFLFLLLLCTIVHCKVPLEDDPGEGPLILTPYVENGETEKAKNLSVVDPSQFAGVKSHAAYFTVDKIKEWNLFFWYFPAQGVPLDSTPLIVWLQGEPGVSSMFGLFNEIGPLQIKDGKVERMDITWGSNYSLLFIDNPVGTGFSFSEFELSFATNQDMIGECLLSFIQQFLQVFPELRKAPLFITGESYAGKYIPAFGHYIHHNKNDSMPINLRGLAIGNGWIDPATQLHRAEFAQQTGLIDFNEAAEIHAYEVEARQSLEDADALYAAYQSAGDAFQSLIYYGRISNVYNYIDDPKHSREFVDFLNKSEIQDAIHAKRMQYDDLNLDVSRNLQEDKWLSIKPWLEELLENYGVMCYSGQLDVKVAYALSVHTYRSLKWSGHEGYYYAKRKPIYDETNPDKINYYVKAHNNFMEVMVRAAGHMVPADQPRAAKQMIDMFVQAFI